MTTIRDVAKRAGVAPITVSRVLNNSGYVSDDTRARVMVAAVELNYVPNMLARSFRSSRTETIALVLTDITNPFWTTVARGAEDAASAGDYTVLFCNTDEQELKQTKYISMLVRRRIDGVLLVPARSSIDAVQTLQQHDIAVVVLDRRVPGAQVDIVRSDSIQAARALTEHLIANGHRRIGMLGGPQGLSVAEERIEGYGQALRAAALPLEAGLIVRGGFSVDSGADMTLALLDQAEPPTALLASNNFMAVGALNALRARGLGVPDDMSVVCFDDLPTSHTITPFFTVMAQQAYDLGRVAADRLMARLDAGTELRPEEIVLPTELIQRQSVRRVES